MLKASGTDKFIRLSLIDQPQVTEVVEFIENKFRIKIEEVDSKIQSNIEQNSDNGTVFVSWGIVKDLQGSSITNTLSAKIERELVNDFSDFTGEVTIYICDYSLLNVCNKIEISEWSMKRRIEYFKRIIHLVKHSIFGNKEAINRSMSINYKILNIASYKDLVFNT